MVVWIGGIWSPGPNVTTKPGSRQVGRKLNPEIIRLKTQQIEIHDFPFYSGSLASRKLKLEVIGVLFKVSLFRHKWVPWVLYPIY